MRPRRRGNAKEWRELGLTIKKDAIGFPSEETIAWISTSLPRFGGDHARSVCDTLSCMANPRAGKIVEIEEASKIKSYWPFSVSFYTPYEDGVIPESVSEMSVMICSNRSINAETNSGKNSFRTRSPKANKKTRYICVFLFLNWRGEFLSAARQFRSSSFVKNDSFPLQENEYVGTINPRRLSGDNRVARAFCWRENRSLFSDFIFSF